MAWRAQHPLIPFGPSGNTPKTWGGARGLGTLNPRSARPLEALTAILFRYFRGNMPETGCAWAVPGGIPSGWGQFGAVKKWAVVMGGLRRQLNAL